MLHQAGGERVLVPLKKGDLAVRARRVPRRKKRNKTGGLIAYDCHKQDFSDTLRGCRNSSVVMSSDELSSSAESPIEIKSCNPVAERF